VGRIENFRDLGCLVTGASAGIGREIARLLAKEGARLVVTARRADRLEDVAAECRTLGAGVVEPVAADLSIRSDVDRLADAAAQHLGHVDVLVNNAGFAVPGRFVSCDLERTHAMVEVNVQSALRLLHHFLPGMLKRDAGGVLNVASVAGFQPAPYQSGYSGTKAFLVNLSEGVYQETKHTNVVVCTLCPGVTNTEFFDAAGYRHLGKFMDRRMPAEKVARAGLDGLKRGRMTVVPGFSNRALLLVTRFVPRRLAGEVARRLMGGRTRR